MLDVSEDVASKRRMARAGRPELYDDTDFQRRLSGFYRDLEQHFPGDRIVHVNGEHDRDVVLRDVLAAVDALRAEG